MADDEAVKGPEGVVGSVKRLKNTQLHFTKKIPIGVFYYLAALMTAFAASVASFCGSSSFA